MAQGSMYFKTVVHVYGLEEIIYLSMARKFLFYGFGGDISVIVLKFAPLYCSSLPRLFKVIKFAFLQYSLYDQEGYKSVIFVKFACLQ